MSTSTVALREALSWHDQLMHKLHRGRGDKEKTVRGRLSDESGVPESYLFRMTHKRRDMRDIAGEPYRLIRLAYLRICEGVEHATDELDRKRREIEETNATDTGHPSVVARVASAAQGKEVRG